MYFKKFSFFERKCFVFSDISGIQQTPVDVTPSPAVNDPFSRPCFSDIDNQLVPSDAADFVTITYRWEVTVDGVSYDLPAGAINPSRVQINPATGNSNNFICQ